MKVGDETTLNCRCSVNLMCPHTNDIISVLKLANSLFSLISSQNEQSVDVSTFIVNELLKLGKPL
jgi:hypothetical protein